VFPRHLWLAVGEWACLRPQFRCRAPCLILMPAGSFVALTNICKQIFPRDPEAASRGTLVRALLERGVDDVVAGATSVDVAAVAG
jgi:hypothetical protein